MVIMLKRIAYGVLRAVTSFTVKACSTSKPATKGASKDQVINLGQLLQNSEPSVRKTER